MAPISSSRIEPTITVGWRRTASRSQRLCATTGAAMSAGATAISVADARIEQSVADVDREIDQHIGGREQQDDALDDRVVAAQDGIDGEPADAGDGEHRLGNDDAADKARHAEDTHRD